MDIIYNKNKKIVILFLLNIHEHIVFNFFFILGSYIINNSLSNY